MRVQRRDGHPWPARNQGRSVVTTRAPSTTDVATSPTSPSLHSTVSTQPEPGSSPYRRPPHVRRGFGESAKPVGPATSGLPRSRGRAPLRNDRARSPASSLPPEKPSPVKGKYPRPLRPKRSLTRHPNSPNGHLPTHHRSPSPHHDSRVLESGPPRGFTEPEQSAPRGILRTKHGLGVSRQPTRERARLVRVSLGAGREFL